MSGVFFLGLPSPLTQYSFRHMHRTKLLIVDDESSQRELLAGFLNQKGFDVTQASSGEDAYDKYPQLLTPVVLADMKMPGMSGLELLKRLREINPFVQVIVLTAFGSVESAVEAMRAGAYDFLTKPVQDLNELLGVLNKAAQQNQLVVEYQVMATRLAESFPDSEIIGNSPAIRKVKEMIALVGPKEATVLILGASGTGKELVARGIHATSERVGNRLVAINCAAFPETLLEAELFGFERGAFTGADRMKQGRFELAEGGTLFLDEIGEMPLPMQAKLLRVLEERKIQRLGAVKEITLDTRLIAASNRNLEQMVREGKFREDLYYRLNVISIELPPLAERGGDILLLAKAFIDRYARKMGKEITGLDPRAADLLLHYAWPGNVRELDHIIERAMILARGNSLTADQFDTLGGGRQADPTEVRPLADVERDAIENCLRLYDWNMTACAEKLGIHRNTLRLKIKEYGLVQPKG